MNRGSRSASPPPLALQLLERLARIGRREHQPGQRPVLLVDGSKFDRPALTHIADVGAVATILAADVPDAALRPLACAGIDVRSV